MIKKPKKEKVKAENWKIINTERKTYKLIKIPEK